MKLMGISFAKFQSCHLLLYIALALDFNQVSTTNETDRFVLLQFKAGIIRDPFGVLNSWNNSIGFCQWYGVTCSRRHQRVTILDLSSQRLLGSISPHIGNLSFIRELLLQNNSFNGEIPPQIGQLRRLHILGLHNNSLIGEIPKNISSCLDLVMLLLGYNHLTREIPGDLGSLLKLRRLDLYANDLFGSVPSSTGNLSSLEILYLTRNNLGGSIPQVLGQLSNLHLIGIRFNRLSGVLGMALNAALIYLFRVKKDVNVPISSFLDDLHMKISYETLSNATEGFCSTNVIGVGNFGFVYKGILQDNGTFVAVKVLHLTRQGALNSFLVECKASKNIIHRNILKILSVCSFIDHHGNHCKALIYEYMVNGSLKCWLHPCTTSSHGNELSKKLNFIWRINIAIDVACALDYLHHQCPIPIVHGDLKPSNILLDAEMVAHVGDFGLAKFLDTLTNQTSSMVRGTTDYIPPEYGMGCKASREGDVYSYGILLLELFTGLSPTGHRFRDNLTLYNFVVEALPERVLEITDIFLLQEREGNLDPHSGRRLFSRRNEIFQECLVMVYDIGVACSYQIPGRRISISKVPHRLLQIKKKLFAWGFYE